MTEKIKKLVREEVEARHWTPIWRCSEMPCEFLDEEVQLMYENMDGGVETCEAIYTYDKGKFHHQPYFKRKSDGARMVNLIAWREL